MNQRTILLLSLAGAVGLLYMADSGYRAFIEQPTQQYEGKLTALDEEQADAQVAQLEGRRLSKRLEEYAERSLPFDPELARSKYQDWLLQLVESHEMKSAAVDADTPRPIEVRSRTSRSKRRLIGHSISYTLRSRTNLAHLTDFLYDFHRSAQLHKIRGFSLTPLSDGSQLDLNLTIESLALQATEREDVLSDWVRTDESFPRREEFDAFVQRNLFAKGFSKVLGEIRLTAITVDRGGESQAWFETGKGTATQKLRAGEELSIPLHTVRVIGFEDKGVRVSVNEMDCVLGLGESLGDVLQTPQVPLAQGES